MQMLRAMEETRIHPVYSPYVNIMKLQNPVCYYMPIRTSPAPRAFPEINGRMKMAGPKRPAVEESTLYESDCESLPIQTPPQSPRFTRRPKNQHTPGFNSSNYCNYRRFSSRKRTQTEFLGVDEALEDCGQLLKKKPKRRNGINRKLFFQETQTLQQEKQTCQESELLPLGQVDTKQQLAEGGVKDVVEDCKGSQEKEEGSEESHENTTPRSRDVIEREFPIGCMVWGKLPGYSWWPGTVVSYNSVEGIKDEQDDEGGDPDAPKAWIKWFGETQLSKIVAERFGHYYEFKRYCQLMQLRGTYKKAIFASIKEAAKRCKVTFISSSEDKKLRWIISDDSALPKLLSETEEGERGEAEQKTNQEVYAGELQKIESVESISQSGHEGEETAAIAEPVKNVKGKSRGRGKKGRGKNEKAVIKVTSLEQEMIEWAYGGFLPAGKEGLAPSREETHIQVVPIHTASEERDEGLPRKRQKVMLLQVRSKARFDSIADGRAKLSDVCIGCGDFNIVTDHPLFVGGLCAECKNGFMENAYLFDEDGSQMYCTICTAGEEVFMCDAENCSKVFCGGCIEKLCGAPELNKVRASKEWLCYMCSPKDHHIGLLEKRDDWDQKLRDLFLNDFEREYDGPVTYKPIPPEERRPIRVLGLFDGIATGLVVLKDLGLEVAQYIASEVDTDAVCVTMVQHKEVLHVGDIEKITEKEIQAWGPFDLIIGGSPCNDLSVVNPARRGIYEGTGRLFFEFFRILSYARPQPGEERPFFWLFENVVTMKPQDKQTISRFLQCNPVVVDAKDISAAHRARYFWGNLPGMNRPTTPLPSDRLTLQSCLEPNCFRVAQFTKLRTITTKMNSIKQTKKAIFPVKWEGQGEEENGDVLWCTEMERLFGFPDHYTDVANLGRAGRQRLLGKAWSVPVIRHLLSPLKEYFRSATTMETTDGARKLISGPNERGKGGEPLRVPDDVSMAAQ